MKNNKTATTQQESVNATVENNGSGVASIAAKVALGLLGVGMAGALSAFGYKKVKAAKAFGDKVVEDDTVESTDSTESVEKDPKCMNIFEFDAYVRRIHPEWFREDGTMKSEEEIAQLYAGDDDEETENRWLHYDESRECKEYDEVAKQFANADFDDDFDEYDYEEVAKKFAISDDDEEEAAIEEAASDEDASEVSTDASEE